MSTPLQPFQNESQSLAIGELTVENRVDQVELYGSLAITRDKAGLQLARELKAVLDATLAHLENATDLPEQIALRPADSVDNPFK
ncbi:MAG: hypothetical protein RL404_636 [Pseudomonadota bacterium]|jgi:hypothetical protein